MGMIKVDFLFEANRMQKNEAGVARNQRTYDSEIDFRLTFPGVTLLQ